MIRFTADTLDNLLRSIGACAEARAWARGKTLAEAWAACEEPEWMAWLAVRMAGRPGWPTRRQVALAAAACAETVLPFAAEAEPAARAAIEAVRRLAAGEASTADVRAAAAAAYAAYSAAAAAAAYAAYATADAAYITADTFAAFATEHVVAALVRARGVSLGQARGAVADILRTLPIPALETKP